MKEYIEKCVNDAIDAKQKLAGMKEDIENVSKILIESFNKGGKVILCGNGGSAADAQHIAAEFVGLLDKTKDRPSMESVALTTNTSILTAIGNDFGYDEIFSRQVAGIAKEGDVIIGISTSGNSPNVVKALEVAKTLGVKTISMTGGSGGKMGEIGVDYVLKAPADNCNRIQELHITLGHIICGVVERELHNIA